MQGLPRILAEIRHEVYEAERKHPFFADYPLELMPGSLTAEELTAARSNIEEAIRRNARISGTDILAEELAEAHDAYAQRDLHHARQELAQCAAVICRMMAMLPAPRNNNNPQR